MRIGQKYVNDYIYSDYSKELNIRDKQTVKNLQPNVEFSQVFWSDAMWVRKFVVGLAPILAEVNILSFTSCL